MNEIVIVAHQLYDTNQTKSINNLGFIFEKLFLNFIYRDIKDCDDNDTDIMINIDGLSNQLVNNLVFGSLKAREDEIRLACKLLTDDGIKLERHLIIQKIQYLRAESMLNPSSNKQYNINYQVTIIDDDHKENDIVDDEQEIVDVD